VVEMNNLSSPELTEAVRLWTGWGESMMPTRNDNRLAERFGSEVASRLLSLIKSLEDDFYSSDARFVATSLEEMEKLACEHFRQKHPSVADEIAKAFAWCYTFDFK